MVITIDGAAGSGKSTVARKLAASLNIPYLDTGAMYRALAFAALDEGINFSDADALVACAANVRLEVDCGPTHTRVRVNGRDVSELIRTLEVANVTSAVAKRPAIRALLVEHQQRIGGDLGSFVTEGRDQGTVVFPDADAKFVLEATLDARARRRHDELRADGQEVTIEEVRRNLEARDAVDAKQWEPLLKSGEATIIDTTNLTIQAVIEKMLEQLGRQASV